jgi:hypothetical protein
MNRTCTAVFLTALTLLFTASFTHNASAMFSGGYVLTGAYGGASTVLLDSTGGVAFTWDHSKLTDAEGRLNGYSCYLLPNGNLLRSAIVPENTVASAMAPRQGIIQEIDHSGKIVWRYQLANDTFMLHHDIKPMPNGHVLAVTFVVQTKAQMIATGVDTAILGRGASAAKFILSEKIIEIDPKASGGPKIIWEWRMYDHVIRGDSAAAHPELFSGTICPALFYTNQWVHLNGLDYNPKLDMILFSSRIFSELYIIDHGTTTQEASGHTGGKRGKGGDLLYRWGKPANYKATGGTTINVLHCVNWIPETYPGGGDIIFFHNNGSMGMAKSEAAGMKSSQSQVIEVKPPMDANGVFSFTPGQPFGPAQPTWLFAPTDSFYSMSMSSAFRLPNGNTLAQVAYPSNGGGMDISGNSIIVEVDNSKKVLSKIPLALKGEAVEKSNPSKYNPAKIMFYEKNFAGILALLSNSGIHEKKELLSPGSPYSRMKINRRAGVIEFSDVAGCTIDLFNMQGKKVYSTKIKNAGISVESAIFPRGLYCARISLETRAVAFSMINIVN